MLLSLAECTIWALAFSLSPAFIRLRHGNLIVDYATGNVKRGVEVTLKQTSLNIILCITWLRTKYPNKLTRNKRNSLFYGDSNLTVAHFSIIQL